MVENIPSPKEYSTLLYNTISTVAVLDAMVKDIAKDLSYVKEVVQILYLKVYEQDWKGKETVR